MRVRCVIVFWMAIQALSTTAQMALQPAGEGSAEAPYQISQLGHLVWMDETVSQSSNVHYRLMNDIDVAETVPVEEEEKFRGIGDDFSVVKFMGYFDGAGHSIRNLSLRQWGNSGGLFGTLGPGSVVENLALIGCRIVGSGGDTGAIADANCGGVIRHCLVAAYMGGVRVGGIVCVQESGRIERCTVTGCVTARYDPDSGEIYGGNVGGVVYELMGGTVTQCYSTAYLTDVSAFGSKGGFVWGAWPSGEMSDSYWDMDTAGTSSSACYVAPDAETGVGGRSSADMRRQATFAGWDFENTWAIEEDRSTPYLRAFPPPFYLSVLTNGAGRVEIDPLKAFYQPGEVVKLTAWSDAPGFVFARWNGGASNQLSTVTTVTMDGHRMLEAVFVMATDVSTVEELQAINNNMSGTYRLVQDIDATATAAWNDGAGFAPLGSYYQRFTGIFDGNGHVVRGLTVNRPESAGIGLFSEVGAGAIIRRLTLEGGTVSGSAGVGGFAGFVYGGRLEECGSECFVSGERRDIGGLVGLLRSGSLVKCYATGRVGGGDYVGGLVGKAAEGTNLIEHCYAMGPVEGTYYVGGLIGSGMSDSRIDQCFATGPVKGEYQIGGLVGQFYAFLLRRSFAVGHVMEVENSSNVLGGLLGNSPWVTAELESGGFVGECYAAGRLITDWNVPGLTPDLFWPNSPDVSVYWDMETGGKWPVNEGPNRLTAQMKQRSTFVDWDFENVWDIEEGVSYPFLRESGEGLRLNVVAVGDGHVEVSPRKARYAPGEKVTLTAVPASNSVMLAYWTGAVADEDSRVTTVTMDIHKTVVAEFSPAIDIATVEELQLIGSGAEYPENGCYRLTHDIDASATAAWNDGAGFIPCRLSNGGVLDGQSHQIKGLSINNPPHYPWAGLISGLEPKCVIRNLGLSSCSVAGYDAGSLAGLVFGGGRIVRCFAEASVTGAEFAGGLVGRLEGTIANSYAVGHISSASGLAGGAVGAVGWNGRLLRSYAAATVAGGAGGGLVGQNDFIAERASEASFWDMQASGCEASACGEGKSTADMRLRTTFTGWDFSTVWGIDEGVGYPFLWFTHLSLPVDTPSGCAPEYAAWAAAHTNIWGTADFSVLPWADFSTAWLLDERPAAGFAGSAGFAVSRFELGDEEILVELALTVGGAAKQGPLNGWLAVEGLNELGGTWETVAAQQPSDVPLSFMSGSASVVFTRPAGFRFFRPVVRMSGGGGTALRAPAPTP